MKNNYSCNTSMLDILFNMLLGFVMLFVIAFALIRKETPKRADVNIVGNLIITLTWPSNRDDDIDLWVRDPNGAIVFFDNRQAGLMYLDRDDVGLIRDVIVSETGTVQSIGNQEMVTVRGLQAGEYVINVHAFLMREKGAVPVSIRVDRIGSPSTILAAKNLVMERTGHEKTAIRLKFDARGKLESTNVLHCSLFDQRKRQRMGDGMGEERRDDE